MATDGCSKAVEAYPMKGGEGTYSYSKNSSCQRGIAEFAKELIEKAIEETLDFKSFSSSKSFGIADLGCSVGPNTFFVVQKVIEAVKRKCHIQGLDSRLLEFQVFFNDLILNDFNTLFASMPPDRQYLAMAVPGSFYSRLFPVNSVHFLHSSYAIQWLSKLPNEVLDKNSSAWNKGRIHYSDSPVQVLEAYRAQYAKDLECFLNARAQEIVPGGLMALIFPGSLNAIPPSQNWPSMLFDLLGSCLMDMAQKGLVDAGKVNSFNIPVYFPSPSDIERAVEKNGCFKVDKIEELPHPAEHNSISEAHLIKYGIRAILERLISEHFGHEILNELFDLYGKKLEEPCIYQLGKTTNSYVLLKRI